MTLKTIPKIKYHLDVTSNWRDAIYAIRHIKQEILYLHTLRKVRKYALKYFVRLLQNVNQ